MNFSTQAFNSSSLTRLLAAIGLSALVASCTDTATTTQAANDTNSRDYMVAVSRPGNLNLIDLQTNKIIKECRLPGNSAPGTVVMSPDTKIAYVLANRFEDIYGLEVDTCKLVFKAQQSSGNERVKSMGALAISPDGSEIYTHQNPVRLMNDHYEIQDTRVAVFDTASGLKAKAIRTLPAPRQITIMATDDSGSLYLSGADVYKMDVNTGATEIAIPSRSVNDPAYAQRDILTVWPIGQSANEFIRMYSVAKYLGEPGDINDASWHWGYERVDLVTGETEATLFGPLEVVLFTGMTRPGHRDQMWGVLTQLKQFDIPSQTEVRSIELEHTYYCISFSTDGSRVYLGGALSDIAVYDAESLKKITNIQLSGDMSMATTQVFSRESVSL
jgi:quinohemoprotein amine dehydrogenase beta subunit